MDPIRSKDTENTSDLPEPDQITNGTGEKGAEPVNTQPEYSTANYDDYQLPTKPRRNLKKPLIILFTMLIISAAAVAAYALVLKKDNNTPNLDAPCKNGLCQEGQTAPTHKLIST